MTKTAVFSSEFRNLFTAILLYVPHGRACGIKNVCLSPAQSFWLRGAAAHYKVQNQRNHGKNQQQVNQSTCDMENRKTTNPSNQQDHKQDRPDTHFFFSSAFTRDFAKSDRVLCRKPHINPTPCPCHYGTSCNVRAI